MISQPFSMEVAEAMMQPNVNMSLAAEIFFESGTTRVHVGVGDIVLGGNVYQGVGALGGVGNIEEKTGTSATKLPLTLSGVDNAHIAIALNENCVNRKANCYVVVFDDKFKTLAYNLLFRGTITASSMQTGKDASIGYDLSNILVEWDKGQPWRFTDSSHQKMFPGDAIMRYVAQMSERSIYWGSKKDAPSFRYV